MPAKKSKQQIDRELDAWLQRSPRSARIVEAPLHIPSAPKKPKTKAASPKKTKAKPKTKRKTKAKAAPRKPRKTRAKTAPRKPRKTRAKTTARLQPARNVALNTQDLALDIVRDAVAVMPTEGRYGDKVYISEIWKRVGRRILPTLPEFKRWLLEQNRRGKLVLVRGDLIGAMDSSKIAESEIQDRGAVFHFVLDPAFSW